MNLPVYVQTAISLLEDVGYEVYVVGGAVRDYLLGFNPNDFDLSTNATPVEVKKVFKNFFIIETGLKHGTISVMINNHLLEITTFRYEKDYQDYRRPNIVLYIQKLEDDLSRRDFTINAIAYNKRIFDYNGGIEDLNNKIIRAIGDPVARFSEDPLRILRGLRFAATLGFEIEQRTKATILELYPLLKNISKERINNEFSRLILGKDALNILLEYEDLITEYVLGFKMNYLEAIKYLDYNLELRLALIALSLKEEDVEYYYKRLKYSKKQIRAIMDIIKNFNLKLNNDQLSILLILKNLDYLTLGNILKIKRALYEVDNNNENVDELFIIYKEAQTKYFRIKDLRINGKDLIKLGYNEGVEIKIVLEKLLDDCINGLENTKEVLIKKAKEYLAKD